MHQCIPSSFSLSPTPLYFPVLSGWLTNWQTWSQIGRCKPTMASDLGDTLRSSIDLWWMETGSSSWCKDWKYSALTRGCQRSKCAVAAGTQRGGNGGYVDRRRWAMCSSTSTGEAAETATGHSYVAFLTVHRNCHWHQRWPGAIPRLPKIKIVISIGKFSLSSSINAF